MQVTLTQEIAKVVNPKAVDCLELQCVDALNVSLGTTLRVNRKTLVAL